MLKDMMRTVSVAVNRQVVAADAAVLIEIGKLD
jgi:hypothetical protein